MGEQHSAYGAEGGGGQEQVAAPEGEAPGGDAEGGNEAAHAGYGQQVAAQIGVGLQDFDGEQGQQKPQGMEDSVGDEGQQHNVQDFPLLAPQVPQAVADVGYGGNAPAGGAVGGAIIGAIIGATGAIIGRRGGGGVPGAHRQQHQDDAQIQRRFQGEVPVIGAQVGDQQAAGEGAEDAGSGDGQGVDGVGVDHRRAGDGVGNQHLLHGLGDGQEGAGDQHIGVGVPGPDVVAADQEGEGQGQQAGQQLDDDDQLAPVQAVAEDAGEGVDDQARQGVDGAGG